MRRFVLLLPACLLAFAALAAEVPVSDVVLGNPPGSRSAFAAASDGDGFLTAWIDLRAYEPQLLATRITRGGQILDPTAIRLGRGNAARPQILWNGQRYLVFQGGTSLTVTEVTREGAVSGPRTLLQNVNFDAYRGASVATNGSRIVAVYGDRNGFLGSPDKLRAGVFDMNANFIGDAVIEQADANQYRMTRLQPSIAVNGSQFVVAWNLFGTDDQLQLKAVRLASNGSVIDAQPHAIGSAGLETSIAANGSGYVAISTFSSWGVSADLGTVTTAVELPVATSDNAVVIHRNGRATLFGTQSGEDGAVLSAADFDDQGHGAPAQALSVQAQGALAAASNGSEVVVLAVVFNAAEESGSVVATSTTVSASTLQKLTESAPLTKSAPRQAAPAIASNDTDMLVAWHESGDVYAGRVLASGAHPDGRGLLLGTGERDVFPSAVFDGQRYVVAFAHYKSFEEAEVVVRFISPQSGLLSNEIRIPGTSVGSQLSLVKGKDAVLLVWSDALKIYATRINDAMQMVDPPVELASGGPVSPVAAWNGTEYLIVWRTAAFDFDNTLYPSIAGIRMSAALTPLDTERVFAAVPDRQHMSVSLVSNGPLWLMAYSTKPMFSADAEEIRVVALNGGVLVGGGAVIPAAVVDSGYAPKLVTAGTKTWLAFKEATPERSIRLVPLTAAGTVDSSVLQRFAAPTPATPEWQESFGLAAKGSQVLLAYPRLAGAEAGWVPRVYANSFSGQAAPGKRRSARS